MLYGCSKAMYPTVKTLQRCRKDFLIEGGGRAQYVFVVHDIEWAWNRQKTWGDTCPQCPPGSYAYALVI